MEDWKNKLIKNIDGEFHPDYPLSKLSGMGVGGKTSLFLILKSESEVLPLLEIRDEFGFPIFVIGEGKNTLFRDEGFPGVVLRLAGDFQKIAPKGDRVWVGSGIRLFHLLNFFISHGWGGIEGLSGVPGSVGGALVMNTGGENFSLGEVVESVEIWDGKTKKTIKPEFAYRRGVNTTGIILGAMLRFISSDKKQTKEKIREMIKKRKEKFPYSLPSLGCIFKNPSPQMPAGFLIERAGLKGFRVGGALISPKHANFIVRVGKCKSRDILDLMEIIREKVYRMWGILLESEIKIV